MTQKMIDQAKAVMRKNDRGSYTVPTLCTQCSWLCPFRQAPRLDTEPCDGDKFTWTAAMVIEILNTHEIAA